MGWIIYLRGEIFCPLTSGEGELRVHMKRKIINSEMLDLMDTIVKIKKDREEFYAQ